MSVTPESKLSPLNALRRGARVSLLTQVTAKLAAFLLALVLARYMTVEDYGTYVLVNTWLLILVVAGLAGVDTSALRFLAQYSESETERAKIPVFIRWSHLRVIITGGSVAMVAAVFCLFLGLGESRLDRLIVVAGLITLPLLAISILQQSILRAFRKIAHADLVGLIIRPVTIAALALAAVYFSIDINATDAIVLLLIGTSASVVAGAIWMRSLGASHSARSPTVEESRLWGRTALPMLWISASHFLLHQLDILMLGALAGPGDVAPYAVASRLADLVAFSLVVASGIVAPLIASLYHAGRLQELQRLLWVAGRWASLVALALAVLMVAGPIDFLGLFGEKYSSAFVVLTILIGGQLINAVSGPISFLLSMTDNQQGSARILGAGVVMNALLNFLLIPAYQEIGAAMATAATTIFWNVCMTVYASSRLRLRATPF